MTPGTELGDLLAVARRDHRSVVDLATRLVRVPSRGASTPMAPSSAWSGRGLRATGLRR